MRRAVTGLRFMLCWYMISTRFGSFKIKAWCEGAKPQVKPKAMELWAGKAGRCQLRLNRLSGVARSLTLRSRGGPTARHQAWATGCGCPFSVAQAWRPTVGLPLS
jgi:hypothetical protein